MRAELRAGVAGPGCARSSGGIGEPALNMPDGGRAGPRRAELRVGVGGPECRRSGVGVEDPGRARLRMDACGPDCAGSGTGSEDTGPGRARPRSGMFEPERADALAEALAPR